MTRQELRIQNKTFQKIVKFMQNTDTKITNFEKNFKKLLDIVNNLDKSGPVSCKLLDAKGEIIFRGEKGLPGIQGPPGNNIGIDGMPGPPGPPGIQGRDGNFGKRGIRGVTGERGPPGLVGLRGSKGAEGDVGVRGCAGYTRISQSKNLNKEVETLKKEFKLKSEEQTKHIELLTKELINMKRLVDNLIRRK